MINLLHSASVSTVALMGKPYYNIATRAVAFKKTIVSPGRIFFFHTSTNHNPRVILHYFLDCVEQLRGKN